MFVLCIHPLTPLWFHRAKTLHLTHFCKHEYLEQVLNKYIRGRQFKANFIGFQNLCPSQGQCVLLLLLPCPSVSG